MQNPAAVLDASAADRPPDRYVVRPAGMLADILGAADLGEEELLLTLRELGLITYPSPLLGGLTEKLPEVLAAEVLPWLEPTDVVVFGQVARACRAAVVAFGVPQEEEMERWSDDSDDSDHEGTGGGPLLLRVMEFVGSVERLAWAKERGCPWDHEVFAAAAFCENLDVLRWAWERRCPWNWQVCCSRLAPRGAAGDLRNWRLRVSPHPTSSYATATTLNSRWPPMKRTSTSPTRSRARAPASTPAVARPER